MNHAGSHANAGGQVAVAFNARQDPDFGPVTHPVDTDGYSLAVAVQERAVSTNPKNGPNGRGWHEEVAYTLEARDTAQNVAYGYAIRRLTPRECERLMGIPDDYTRIAWRGAPAELCPDGPRYRVIGNSWAVPVARWIGQRIEVVSDD